MPPRLTRFFLSATSPPLLSHFYPRDFPSSSPKAQPSGILREFLRLESISRRGFSNSATFLFFSSFFFSLFLFRSVFLAQLFPFDTGESRIERNALSAIIYYCSPLSFPRLLEENYVFLQLSKRTEVEGKWRSETFNTSALLLTWYGDIIFVWKNWIEIL